MKSTRLFFGLLLLAAFGRLAAQPAALPTTPATAPLTPEPAAAPGVTNADYRIAPRDTIQFQIYNQPDMLTLQRVTSAGEVRLPLIGTVKLGDSTLREAELRLEALYRAEGFFVDPQVILSVQLYGDRFVAVLGQVKNPARIALASEVNTMGLLQAVTEAGGFTRVARTEAVQVIRTNPSGQEERLTVNMDDILKPKTVNQVSEFQLKPGDIVFVPERVF